MNEKTVLKTSIYVFLVGCIILGLIGIYFNDISYILGFILGYIINVIVYLLIIKMSEGILKFSMSIVIIVIMFIVKLALYALGFYVAVKMSQVHLLGVFLGYLVTKVTIFMEGWLVRQYFLQYILNCK